MVHHRGVPVKVRRAGHASGHRPHRRIVPPPQGRSGSIFPHSVGRDRDIPPTTPPERATARLCGRSLVVLDVVLEMVLDAMPEGVLDRRIDRLLDVAPGRAAGAAPGETVVQNPGSGHVSAKVVTLSSAAR